MMEEPQVQQVCIALVFSPPLVVSSSHIDDDEEGMDSIASTEVEGMVNGPPLSSS